VNFRAEGLRRELVRAIDDGRWLDARRAHTRYRAALEAAQ
jgi:hypothetical protein